jgi:diadenylate cyclase
MPLARQTITLLKAASQLVQDLPADALLFLTEKDLEWKTVRSHLEGCRLLVAAEDLVLKEKLKAREGLTVLDIDPGPTPTHERLSMALLEAVRSDLLRPGAVVVTVYNGIDINKEPEGIDSLSIIHLGEHLERLSAKELRNLDTQVPLETLRAVVDLATEIGREGREAHPVGTLFVVGDTRKVMSMSVPMNFNPFRGYSREERDIRKRAVREQLKDIAQLEGAIIISREGVAEAAAVRIEAPSKSYTLSMGLGTRHAAAAAVTKSSNAIAVAVSQSSGTVRLFQDGEIVLRIEPMSRPMIWGRFSMDGTGEGHPPDEDKVTR